MVPLMFTSSKFFTRFRFDHSRINNYRSLSLSRSATLDEQKQMEIETKRKELMNRGLPKRKPLKGVKQIFIVASGKGGVGKSTTAVNLSAALKVLEPKKSVGLLDADVFGPSIPLMMNIRQSPVIWRGLMVMSAIDKLLYRVAWGPLDYLVVDTPPGTGDTHLSIIQNLPIAGALLVTTPQRAALEVTRRGANMFKRLNIPIAGIVENMSSVVCPKCNNEITVFNDGTKAIARELGVQILETLPLSEDIAESCDTGKPIVLSAPKSIQAHAYKNLAACIISFLAEQPLQE